MYLLYNVQYIVLVVAIGFLQKIRILNSYAIVGFFFIKSRFESIVIGLILCIFSYSRKKNKSEKLFSFMFPILYNYVKLKSCNWFNACSSSKNKTEKWIQNSIMIERLLLQKHKYSNAVYSIGQIVKTSFPRPQYIFCVRITAKQKKKRTQSLKL